MTEGDQSAPRKAARLRLRLTSARQLLSLVALVVLICLALAYLVRINAHIGDGYMAPAGAYGSSMLSAAQREADPRDASLAIGEALYSLGTKRVSEVAIPDDYKAIESLPTTRPKRGARRIVRPTQIESFIAVPLEKKPYAPLLTTEQAAKLLADPSARQYPFGVVLIDASNPDGRWSIVGEQSRVHVYVVPTALLGEVTR